MVQDPPAREFSHMSVVSLQLSAVQSTASLQSRAVLTQSPEALQVSPTKQ